MSDITKEDYYKAGYNDAKNKYLEQQRELIDRLNNVEKEYAILKQAAGRDSIYIKQTEEYIELGKALKTILDYIKGEINV
jgi:hypothetical protein